MLVYLSYGSIQDQVTALRLQALGAVNGLSVYVPPAYTRESAGPIVDRKAQQELLTSDVVLGVVGAELTAACRGELDQGLSLKKHVIVLSHPAWESELRQNFAGNLVIVDPRNPDLAEHSIVSWLKDVEAQKNTKTALVALATVTLGLILFSAESSTRAR
jgi:hypothetical protein